VTFTPLPERALLLARFVALFRDRWAAHSSGEHGVRLWGFTIEWVLQSPQHKTNVPRESNDRLKIRTLFPHTNGVYSHLHRRWSAHAPIGRLQLARVRSSFLPGSCRSPTQDLPRDRAAWGSGRPQIHEVSPESHCSNEKLVEVRLAGILEHLETLLSKAHPVRSATNELLGWVSESGADPMTGLFLICASIL